MKMKAISTLLYCVFFLEVSCSKPKKDFSTYESTIEYVQYTYKASVLTSSSSDVHRAEYYASSPNRWLVVYFKSDVSKGHIYQKFPMSKWTEWNKASSKGSWYHEHLRGNQEYFFKPSK